MPDRNLNPRRTGFISEMVIQAKLVIRLMKDNRINPLLKILPFGGLIYLVIPDILIGPILVRISVINAANCLVSKHLTKLILMFGKKIREGIILYGDGGIYA